MFQPSPDVSSVLAAGGNSFAARSARAKLQPRDRFGRFIETGRGLKFQFRTPNGSVVSANGVSVGALGPHTIQTQVTNDPNGLKDGFYSIESNNAQETVGALTDEQLKARNIRIGYDVNGQPVGDRLDADIPNQQDIPYSENPIGWQKLDATHWTTDDGDYTMGRASFKYEKRTGNALILFNENGQSEGGFKTWAAALRKVDELDAKGPQANPSPAVQRQTHADTPEAAQRIQDQREAKLNPDNQPDAKARAKEAVAPYDTNNKIANMIDAGASSKEVLDQLMQDSPAFKDEFQSYSTKDKIKAPTKVDTAKWDHTQKQLDAIRSVDSATPQQSAPDQQTTDENLDLTTGNVAPEGFLIETSKDNTQQVPQLTPQVAAEYIVKHQDELSQGGKRLAISANPDGSATLDILDSTPDQQEAVSLAEERHASEVIDVANDDSIPVKPTNNPSDPNLPNPAAPTQTKDKEQNANPTDTPDSSSKPAGDSTDSERQQPADKPDAGKQQTDAGKQQQQPAADAGSKPDGQQQQQPAGKQPAAKQADAHPDASKPEPDVQGSNPSVDHADSGKDSGTPAATASKPDSGSKPAAAEPSKPAADSGAAEPAPAGDASPAVASDLPEDTKALQRMATRLEARISGMQPGPVADGLERTLKSVYAKLEKGSAPTPEPAVSTPDTQPHVDLNTLPVKDFSADFKDLGEWRARAKEDGSLELFQPGSILDKTPEKTRPLEHIFRVISEDEYNGINQNGFMQSDGRMNIADNEGTVATHRDPSFYAPGDIGVRGRIMQMDYNPQDGWRVDSDGYLKTPNQIPADRFTAQSDWTIGVGNSALPVDSPDVPKRLASGLDNKIAYALSEASWDPEHRDAIQKISDGLRTAYHVASNGGDGSVPNFDYHTTDKDARTFIAAVRGLLDGVEFNGKEEALRNLDAADGVLDRRGNSSAPEATTPNTPDNLPANNQIPNLLDRIKEQGGITYDTTTGDEPKDGFIVALQGFSKFFSRDKFFSGGEGAQDIADYIEERKAELNNPNYMMGIWVDKKHNEVVFDIVERFDSRDAAVQAGVERNQQAIWDVAANEEIDTGGTGDRPGQQIKDLSTTKVGDVVTFDTQEKPGSAVRAATVQFQRGEDDLWHIVGQPNGQPLTGGQLMQRVTAAGKFGTLTLEPRDNESTPTPTPDTANPWDAQGPSAAQAYEDMANDPTNPEVSASYSALIAAVIDQYRQIKARGIKMIFGPKDPYANSQEMVSDVQNNKTLKVFADGGATLPDGHPMKQMVNIDGQELNINDVFRGVHDYFGHVLSADRGATVSFGPRGEWEAWRTHRLTLPRESWMALWDETRGQNTWTNYFGNHQDLPLQDRPFAVQKAGVVGPEFYAADLIGTEPAEGTAPAPLAATFHVGDTVNWRGAADRLRSGKIVRVRDDGRFSVALDKPGKGEASQVAIASDSVFAPGQETGHPTTPDAPASGWVKGDTLTNEDLRNAPTGAMVHNTRSGENYFKAEDGQWYTTRNDNARLIGALGRFQTLLGLKALQPVLPARTPDNAPDPAPTNRQVQDFPGLRRTRTPLRLTPLKEPTDSSAIEEVAPAEPSPDPVDDVPVSKGEADSVDGPEDANPANVPEAPVDPAVDTNFGYEDSDADYADEKFMPTQEQRNILKAIFSKLSVAVQALAGSGKTSSLELIARRLKKERPKEKILYIAFNKSVATEAQGRMPDNVEARTGDSIAWQGISKEITKKMNNADALRRPKDIAQHFGITDTNLDGTDYEAEDIALDLGRAINAFSISDHDEISAEDFEGLDTPATPQTLAWANKMWADINSPKGELKFSNTYATKIWALTKPDLSKSGSGVKTPASIIFFDEAQDINPVMAKVIRDQTIQKVYVGDSRQSIYAFRGSVDELDKVQVDVTLPLTQSWRFGPKIAGYGNRFLSLLKSPLKIIGGGPKGEILPSGSMQDPDAILTRTNAGAIDAILEQLDAGRIVGASSKFKKDLQALISTVNWLQNGGGRKKPKLHEDLAGYTTWDQVAHDVERQKATTKVEMLYNMVERMGLGRIQRAVDGLRETDNKPGEKKDVSGVTYNVGDTGVLTQVEGRFGPQDVKYAITQPQGRNASDSAVRLTLTNSFQIKDRLKEIGFRWDPNTKGWWKEGSPESLARDMRDFSNNDAAPVDVVVLTAHRAKGLEWGRVKIGNDFRGPKIVDDGNGESHIEWPQPEEMRLAYVAVTRAQQALDPGSLDWVESYTDTTDEDPATPSKGIPGDPGDTPTPETPVPAEPAQDSTPEVPTAPEPVPAPSAPEEPTPEPTPAASEPVLTAEDLDNLPDGSVVTTDERKDEGPFTKANGIWTNGRNGAGYTPGWLVNVGKNPRLVQRGADATPTPAPEPQTAPEPPVAPEPNAPAPLTPDEQELKDLERDVEQAQRRLDRARTSGDQGRITQAEEDLQFAKDDLEGLKRIQARRARQQQQQDTPAPEQVAPPAPAPKPIPEVHPSVWPDGSHAPGRPKTPYYVLDPDVYQNGDYDVIFHGGQPDEEQATFSRVEDARKWLGDKIAQAEGLDTNPITKEPFPSGTEPKPKVHFEGDDLEPASPTFLPIHENYVEGKDLSPESDAEIVDNATARGFTNRGQAAEAERATAVAPNKPNTVSTPRPEATNPVNFTPMPEKLLKPRPGDVFDPNVILHELENSHPEAYRLPNGDLVLESRDTDGFIYELVVRRNGHEEFFPYILRTNKETGAQDGSRFGNGNWHSARALRNKLNAVKKELRNDKIDKRYPQRKNIQEIPEDGSFRANEPGEDFLKGLNFPRSSAEFNSAVRDLIDYMVKSGASKNLMDRLTENHDLPPELKDEILAAVEKGKIAAANQELSPGTPSHMSYGGERPLVRGDTVDWTDWRTTRPKLDENGNPIPIRNADGSLQMRADGRPKIELEPNPTYGQVFRGTVKGLQWSDNGASGLYVYSDHVWFTSPTYNAVRMGADHPKVNSKQRDFVSSNLKLVDPNSPLSEPFWAKEEEKARVDAIAENPKSAADFGVPENPSGPAVSVPKPATDKAASVKVEHDLNGTPYVVADGTPTPISGPDTKMAAESLNLPAMSVPVSQLQAGDYFYKNIDGVPVLHRVISPAPAGELKVFALHYENGKPMIAYTTFPADIQLLGHRPVEASVPTDHSSALTVGSRVSVPDLPGGAGEITAVNSEKNAVGEHVYQVRADGNGEVYTIGGQYVDPENTVDKLNAISLNIADPENPPAPTPATALQRALLRELKTGKDITPAALKAINKALKDKNLSKFDAGRLIDELQTNKDLPVEPTPKPQIDAARIDLIDAAQDPSVTPDLLARVRQARANLEALREDKNVYDGEDVLKLIHSDVVTTGRKAPFFPVMDKVAVRDMQVGDIIDAGWTLYQVLAPWNAEDSIKVRAIMDRAFQDPIYPSIASDWAGTTKFNVLRPTEHAPKDYFRAPHEAPGSLVLPAEGAPEFITPYYQQEQNMLDSYNAGFTVDKEIMEGNINQGAYFITTADGTELFTKKLGTEEEYWKEIMAAKLSFALGIDDVVITGLPDLRTIISTKVDGTLPSDDFDQREYIEAHMDEFWNAPRIGLLDYLIQNDDRHLQNWIINLEGQPVPIDHSNSSFGDWPGDAYPEFTPAALGRLWHDTFAVDTDPLLTLGELQAMKANLIGLESDFAAIGRTKWLNFVLDNLDALISEY